MPRALFHPCLVLFVLLAWVPVARAQEQAPDRGVIVDVDLGWGGLLRVGRWNPVVVRAQGSAGQAAIYEWYVPRPGRQAMVLRQLVALNPAAGETFAYLPVGPDPQAIHLRVADARTNKTLARWPAEGGFATEALATRQVDERIFVGLSGEDRRLPPLDPTRFTVGPQPADRLPDDAVGLDALDVLALGRPALAGPAAPTPAQQRAVVDWVRGGGRLVLWLGPGDHNPAAPLAGLLPENLAEPQAVDLAGRTGWYTGVPGDWGEVVATVDGRPAARRKAFGLGHVTLLQFDAGLLPPGDVARLLDGPIEERGGGAEMLAMSRSFVERGDRREAWGGWKLLWVVGLVAGPLDTLVLWAAGRRMRRPVPAAGWLLLVVATLGWAASSSSPAERDAAAVLTQAGAKPVALDVFATSAGHDAAALVGAQPAVAWYTLTDGGPTGLALAVPAPDRPAASRSDGPLRDVPFLHAPGGTAWAGKAPVLVGGTAWDVPPGLPRLDVSLRREPDGTVAGAVSNTSGAPLRDVTLATRDGRWLLSAELAPGDVALARPGLAPAGAEDRPAELDVQTLAARAAADALAEGGFVVTARATVPAPTLGLPGDGDVPLFLRAVAR